MSGGNSIKVKKNKLSGLKTYLAYPFTERWLSLDTNELNQLGILLRNVSEKCGKNKILHIGLESSLRCINKCESECVLLSLSIKPRHIINLIVRNVEVKDKTVPVYVVKNLENFIYETFKIKSLCLVITKHAREVDGDLAEWLQTHTKPNKEQKTLDSAYPVTILKQKDQKKMNKKIFNDFGKISVEMEEKEEKVESSDEPDISKFCGIYQPIKIQSINKNLNKKPKKKKSKTKKNVNKK